MATRTNQTSPVVRAGVYTRISWDLAGQRAGVERQRVDCEALCAERGWEIAQYLEDNDRSAYSGKRRAAYERLLTAVDDGRLDAVVTWYNDRLHRSPRELETFIDLVERSGVRVAVVSGDYDLTTPEGRFTARIVGAVARKESEDRSRRVRRMHLELAEQGRPASHLGWGVRDEAERELVREAAGRVLAGQGLITIARDWNRRDVPGATASPWTGPTLRKVLLSARVAGLREHGADPRGRILGALTPAVWQGAIDRRTWDHVRAVLLNPERLTVGNTPTRYLLMGVIFCGVCGGRMFSRPRDDHPKRYVCAGRRPGHQLTIVAQPVDDLVTRQSWSCSRPRTFGRRCSLKPGRPTTYRSGAPSPLWEQRRAVCRRSTTTSMCEGPLANAGTAQFGQGWSGRSSASTPGLIARASSGSSCTPTRAGLWADADFGQRRELIRLVVECVRVMPARRGARFDPARVQLDIPLLDGATSAM